MAQLPETPTRSLDALTSNPNGIVRIAIGTDHGGFHEKNDLVTFLGERGFVVFDMGTYSEGAADYPVFAGRVARAVSSGVCDAGVILCKSGNGVAIVANRFPGVRAAIALDAESAHAAREHNNANTLVMGTEHLRGDYKDIVLSWLATTHDPSSRHGRRVALIDRLDAGRVRSEGAIRLAATGTGVWLATSKVDADDLEARATAGLGGLWLLRESSATDARLSLMRAAVILSPFHKATGGDIGWVCLERPEGVPYSPARLVEEVRHLGGLIPEKNILWHIPAIDDAAGAVELLAHQGASLHASAIGRDDVTNLLTAWSAALSKRAAEGLPIHEQRLVIGLSVPPATDAGRAEAQRAYAQMRLVVADTSDRSLGALMRLGAAMPRVAWHLHRGEGVPVGELTGAQSVVVLDATQWAALDAEASFVPERLLG